MLCTSLRQGANWKYLYLSASKVFDIVFHPFFYWYVHQALLVIDLAPVRSHHVLVHELSALANPQMVVIFVCQGPELGSHTIMQIQIALSFLIYVEVENELFVLRVEYKALRVHDSGTNGVPADRRESS